MCLCLHACVSVCAQVQGSGLMGACYLCLEVNCHVLVATHARCSRQGCSAQQWLVRAPVLAVKNMKRVEAKEP